MSESQIKRFPGAAQGARRRRRRTDPHPQGPPQFVAEKYAVLIDALYAGKSSQYIETQVTYEDGRSNKVAPTCASTPRARPSREGRLRRTTHGQKDWRT